MTNGNPLALALNILTMTLANAEGVELQLNALGLSDVRLTLPEIQARIMYHYKQEVLRQIYRVLGSADFLGNPVGLFTNVSSGVADIFYEPWHGVVQHGGSELGVGIAKVRCSASKGISANKTPGRCELREEDGLRSLQQLDKSHLKRRKGCASCCLPPSLVTDYFTIGLSAATLDADYQAKRRMNQRRNRPRHAL